MITLKYELIGECGTFQYNILALPQAHKFYFIILALGIYVIYSLLIYEHGSLVVRLNICIIMKIDLMRRNEEDNIVGTLQ